MKTDDSVASEEADKWVLVYRDGTRWDATAYAAQLAAESQDWNADVRAASAGTRISWKSIDPLVVAVLVSSSVVVIQETGEKQV